MIADVVRHVAAQLADPVAGVSARLATLPRPETDAAPAAVRVFDEITHPAVVLGPLDEALLAEGPVLLVGHVGASDVPLTPGRLGTVSVAVRYAANERDGLGRDAWQTLRTAARVLAAPALDASMATQVAVRHRVQLHPPTSLAFLSPPPDAAPDAFAPALVVTVPAADPWLLGA